MPRTKGEAVLWFAETYGLIPDSLNLHDVETGEAITIDFKGKGNTVLHELKISLHEQQLKQVIVLVIQLPQIVLKATKINHLYQEPLPRMTSFP